MPQNRGKVLGGSSAINLLVWDRATVAELDSWEIVGNPGWNWDTLYPDMLLAEDFLRNASLYGDSGTAEGGPLGVEIAEYVSPQAEAFIPVMDSLNVTYNDVSLGGNSLGSSYQPIAADGHNHQRSYSPGYLKLATPNLCVQPQTRVHKLVIDDLTAKGVVLQFGQQILASKEVILSAGSIQSPGLLELSGVGNSTVLRAAGVTPVHDLPGVGSNLQDHVRIQNSYQVRPGILSSDELRSNATYRTQQLALYNASQPSIYWGSRTAFAFLNWDQVGAPALKTLAVQAVDADNTTANNQKIQFITNPSKNNDVPQVEIFLSDGYSGAKGYPTDNTTAAYDDGFFTLYAALQHLLSHGSVHITSTNVSVQPAINPNYLSSPYDLQAMTTAAKYIRQIAQMPPLNTYWVSEYEPGMQVQSDADWEYYVRNSSFTIYHPVGTCAMLPLENGGVVDPTLKVYGVKSLRIVDASIMPVLPSGHLQTLVYGIAERAAKIVDAQWK
jgi:choline dehydrogenase-like flavoprotein